MNVLPEVHYGDHEELGPLEPPMGVAAGPVVLRGSRPPGASWSTMSSTMTTWPFTSLTGPPRVVEFSQRPINSRSNPNVSAAFLTLALPPTRAMRTSPS